jgi:NADH-ubiquinone oxidoreductase chain 2
MSNAVNILRESSILYSRISILILIYSILIIHSSYYINFILDGIILFNGLICIQNYIITFSIFIFILSILIISINSFYPFYTNYNNYNIKNIFTNIKNFKELINTRLLNNEKSNTDVQNNIFKSEQFKIIEYPLILLFCISGTVFLMSSFDIISIFLSIELQSYAIYLICSIYRNSESSISGGLTYFLLGGLSSCIILLGISLLYTYTGTTSLENIYIINNISDIFTYNYIYVNSINE